MEHHSMGDVRVPLTAKWQAQTQRAVDNFPVSGRSIDRALELLKRAAALENAQLGGVNARMADAIAEAAMEVAEGRWDAEYRAPDRQPSRVGELPLGATAVGTGVNAPPGFPVGVIKRLEAELGLPLSEARDHFEAHGWRDALVEASGAARTVAVSLYKCATGTRRMGSGPRAGLAEVHIPDLQPGSSIMPGKVNPVIPEAVSPVVAQVIDNDAAVAFGGRPAISSST
jgi:fumarate hydratase class II